MHAAPAKAASRPSGAAAAFARLLAPARNASLPAAAFQKLPNLPETAAPAVTQAGASAAAPLQAPPMTAFAGAEEGGVAAPVPPDAIAIPPLGGSPGASPGGSVRHRLNVSYDAPSPWPAQMATKSLPSAAAQVAGQADPVRPEPAGSAHDADSSVAASAAMAPPAFVPAGVQPAVGVPDAPGADAFFATSADTVPPAGEAFAPPLAAGPASRAAARLVPQAAAAPQKIAPQAAPEPSGTPVPAPNDGALLGAPVSLGGAPPDRAPLDHVAGSASEPAGAGTIAATPAGPAAQMAHAMAALHVGPDGSSHVTIRLDPAELGQVQIRISREHDGAASVTVAVERPETLSSLQADLGHLHQALDRAGVPEQRSVALHLAMSGQGDQPANQGGAGGQGAPQSGYQQGTRQDRAPGAPSAPAMAGPLITPGSSQQQQVLRWQTTSVDFTA
jgi:hypothetical protein